MEVVLHAVRDIVRAWMSQLAVVLNRVTNGRLSPDTVTLFGFAMHVPIALLIATHHYIPAALLLVVFGLFDSLDGALARAQKRVSSYGGFLDASTDRMKEGLLYSGIVYSLALSHHPATATWAAAACGASIAVSYVKAKGEAVVAADKHNMSYTKLNKMFADGLLAFEVRMTILVAGLVFNQLAVACACIAILATLTAFGRLIRIGRYLREA